jgi:sulfide:quinone oxidoreductase
MNVPPPSGNPYDERRPRVVVAGGGVAALEACLALRAMVSDAEVEIELIAPEERFEYRPLAVLEPFTEQPSWGLELARFAADQDVTLRRDGLEAVDPGRRVVRTTGGAEVAYDHLLVALGARAVRHVTGALTFRGHQDADALRRLVGTAVAGEVHSIAFALPGHAFWSLPLYELAMMTAARLAAEGAATRVLVVTPERAPLELFGARASRLVAGLLERHGIELLTESLPLRMDDDGLELADGRRLAVDAAVVLPRLVGRPVDGLPHDESGFLPTDEHARVAGCPGVFAAGDATSSPWKQGGLATQQADAAAESILSDLGLPISPRPFRPVLQGVLYSDHDPEYLQAPLGDSPGAELAPRTYSLWWPPSKIAGRYLAPYLTLRAGAPRAPEVRPEADLVPVEVDVERVHATMPVIGGHGGDQTVPPG